MREIKFRAWNGKEMVYSGGNLEEDNQLDLFFCMWGVRGMAEKLMQYTEFKDNNFKEIYEGDIIHYKDSDTSETTGTITFIKGSYGLETEEGFWTFNCLIGQDTEMYIIGDVYNNPELLK